MILVDFPLQSLGRHLVALSEGEVGLGLFVPKKMTLFTCLHHPNGWFLPAKMEIELHQSTRDVVEAAIFFAFQATEMKKQTNQNKAVSTYTPGQTADINIYQPTNRDL